MACDVLYFRVIFTEIYESQFLMHFKSLLFCDILKRADSTLYPYDVISFIGMVRIPGNEYFLLFMIILFLVRRVVNNFPD